MIQHNLALDLSAILRLKPHAYAIIKGSSAYPEIKGNAWFYITNLGTLCVIEASGLPTGKDCNGKVLALHVHDGNSCSGNYSDPFANALTHYNPGNCPHPFHAGDMPPLFVNSGYALSVFLTDRFSLPQIINRAIIIHSLPDDFTTQPSGNAGQKIACGIIKQE